VVVDCTEVLEQLSDYLDAEARAELCRQIDAHLARCSRCQVHVDTVRKTILLYHIDGPSETPVRVSADLQAALAREYGRAHREPYRD